MTSNNVSSDRPTASPSSAFTAVAVGAISVLLGVILVAQWPASSFVVLGTLVAVELVSRGAAIIGVSLALRSALRERCAGAHA